MLPVGTEVNTAVSIHQTVPVPPPAVTVTAASSDDDEDNDDDDDDDDAKSERLRKSKTKTPLKELDDADDLFKFEADKLFEHVNQRFVGHRNARYNRLCLLGRAQNFYIPIVFCLQNNDQRGNILGKQLCDVRFGLWPCIHVGS